MVWRNALRVGAVLACLTGTGLAGPAPASAADHFATQLSGLPAELWAAAALFSESPSRFVVSVAPEDVVAFESILEERATRLGFITDDGQLRVRRGGQELLRADTTALRAAWTNGPVNQTIGLEPATKAHS